MKRERALKIVLMVMSKSSQVGIVSNHCRVYRRKNDFRGLAGAWPRAQ
jgi:hypothetical protein